MERNIRLNWPGFVEEAIKRRKLQGLTQEQLAILSGVSKPTLNSFEQGKMTVSLENSLKILRALGLEQDNLQMDEDMIAYKADVAGHVDKFDQLGKKIFYIRQEIIAKYAIDVTAENIKKDVRCLVFDHMLQSVEHSRLLLKFADHDGVLTECGNVKIAEEIILKKLIYYQIPCFYHAIENCFFTLLKALTNKGCNSYLKLVLGIFDELSIPKNDDIYKAYVVLMLIRNSMHNNWVHILDPQSADKTITTTRTNSNKQIEVVYHIRNAEFIFIKDQPIAFKSEDYIFILMNTIIESLLTIMCHSEIQKLKSEFYYLLEINYS